MPGVCTINPHTHTHTHINEHIVSGGDILSPLFIIHKNRDTLFFTVVVDEEVLSTDEKTAAADRVPLGSTSVPKSSSSEVK